jgi:hypothetical protein
MWGIDRVTFKKALETSVEIEFDEIRRYIEGIKLFNEMNAD